MSAADEPLPFPQPCDGKSLYNISDLDSYFEKACKKADGEVLNRKNARRNGSSDVFKTKDAVLENISSRLQRAWDAVKVLQEAGQETVVLNPHGDPVKQLIKIKQLQKVI